MGNEDNNDGGDNDLMWSCCNDEQTLFILLYIAFAAVAVITWSTMLAKPMRLIAVFIHEWSHAIACWLTGGDVRKIEVYENEGGVTTFVGGCRCLIIPAGYVGCSFSAMIFVIMSGGRGTATFACVAFTLSMVIVLFYSPNRTLVYLCAAYTVINVTVFVLEYTDWLYSPILQFLILFYGVFVGIYAIADIYDDTVIREIQGSDANACATQVWPCCPPQCIGLQWAFLAVCFQLIGIWIALVEMSEECEDLGWFACLNLSVDFGDFDWDEKNWEWEGFWHQGMETIRWDENVPWNSN